MAQRFWDKQTVFLNSAGVPRAGGKLYSYTTGTTTPLDTFSDDDLDPGDANSNPITLDASGRLAVDVFGTDAQYKFIITNSDGTDSITMDPMNVSDDSALTDLSASGGSALVGYVGTGTGINATTVQAKLRELYPSVKDFGATGDGTTNDATAIQEAMDSGHDVMYWPPGNYKVNSALVPAANQRWVGAGRDATTITSGVDGYLVTTTTSNHRLEVENMTITGSLANANSGGFKLFDPATYPFRNITFTNFNYEAIRLVQGVNVTLDNVTTSNCGETSGQYAVFLDPGATSTVAANILNCYFAGGAGGLKATTCRNLNIVGTIFESNAKATLFNAVDGIMHSCWLEANTQDYDWTDSANMERTLTQSTNGPSGVASYAWGGSSAYQRKIRNGAIAYGEHYRSSTSTATAATWTDVEFSTVGDCYYTDPNPGGAAFAEMEIVLPGLYRVQYSGTFKATTATLRNGALRIVRRRSAVDTEIAGSYRCVQVAASGHATISGEVIVECLAEDSIKLQFGVDHAELELLAFTTGLPAATHSTAAYLSVQHLGTEG